MDNALVIYDADLPIHMKGGMLKLKETVGSLLEHKFDFSSSPDIEKLKNCLQEIDRELRKITQDGNS